MNFLSFSFWGFFIILLILYYLLPLSHRWRLLLPASLVFYWTNGRGAFCVLLAILFLSYGLSFAAKRLSDAPIGAVRTLCFGGILLLVLFPLLYSKVAPDNMVSVLGLSFFTLQILSYLIDLYRGTVTLQTNFYRYATYITFFPQISQGPIPRYNRLSSQLYEGHLFSEETFTRGINLIIWGFFLKLMIADKAAIVVDFIYQYNLTGAYVLVAGTLYSIQLYADFSACVSFARGAALMLGIRLENNFRHPYLAVSIQDFWRRWHISLSEWLRDYIYIPLGGNRKGTLRKYLNLMITFLISGLWHGNGMRYLFWGGMHGLYLIAGSILEHPRTALYRLLHLDQDRITITWLKRIGTFFWVMLAWIIFRSPSLREGLAMILSMFTVHNYDIFFTEALLGVNLSWKEWGVLLVSIAILILVSIRQEKESVSGWIAERSWLFRAVLYVSVVITIAVLGTYGYGFDAAGFIYEGF